MPVKNLDFGKERKAFIHVNVNENSYIDGLDTKLSPQFSDKVDAQLKSNIEKAQPIQLGPKGISELTTLGYSAVKYASAAGGYAHLSASNSFVAGRIAMENNHHLHDLKGVCGGVQTGIKKIAQGIQTFETKLDLSQKLQLETNGILSGTIQENLIDIHERTESIEEIRSKLARLETDMADIKGILEQILEKIQQR